MKAVIFAAGLGTRLRPITETMPKPLVPIAGRSILERTLDALPDAVDEAVIVVGYKGEMIRAAFAGRTGIRFVEQTELRGTYDALLRAAPLLGDGPFLALNGDDLYSREDLARLAASQPAAMLMKRVAAPNPYSHLHVEDGLLSRIVMNKDASGLPAHNVYVGACLLDRRFFALEPARLPNGELGLPHTLEKHLNTNPVQVLEASAWHPVGTLEELDAACRAVAG